MKLVAVTLAAAFAVGYLVGGRLSHLSELKLRFGSIAFLALLLQLIDAPGRWSLVLLLTSFVLLTAFTVANIRTTGFGVILVGVLMNFTVIAVNGGMPVARHAIVASDQAQTLLPLLRDGGAKHHLAGPDDRLGFLADVIAIPAPIRQAVSIGDVFTYGGVALVVVAAMRRRDRLPSGAVPEVARVQA